jgi:hypothetical protein
VSGSTSLTCRCYRIVDRRRHRDGAIPSGSETAYLFGQRHAVPKIIKHGSGQSQNRYNVTTHPQLDLSIGDSGG